MQSYILMLPLKDNAGRLLGRERRKLFSLILKEAGGFTRLTDCTGAWRNGAVLVQEKMTPVLIACDKPATIKTIARKARTLCRQQAIFVTELGKAQLIT